MNDAAKLVADGILQALTAAGGCVRRRQLAGKLRNLGIETDYYNRAAALAKLEAAGKISREKRGHDSRGFCTESVALVPTT